MIRDKVKKLKVLVVGDIMLDTYVMGEVERISPEAPIPIIDVKTLDNRLGGAANVAANLRSLGITTYLSGVIGTDLNSFELLELLKDINIDIDQVTADPNRPTTTKTRIVAGIQQLARYDIEDRTPYIDSNPVYDFPDVDVVIISDYGKGFITDKLMSDVKARYPHTHIVVDPNVNNYSYYRGRISAITPNLKEANSFHESVDVDETGMSLLGYLDCKRVLITLGKRGMVLYKKGADSLLIPSEAKQVFDVSGAGDTVIAMFAIGLALGLKDENILYSANKAAGIVVGDLGTSIIGDRFWTN